MKTKIYLLILIMHPLVLLCQDQANPAPNINTTNSNTSQESYGRDKRISFIVGIGASYITNHLYQDPVINKTNNNVIIANAIKLKTNLSLGIVYTSNVNDNLITVHLIDAQGNPTVKTFYEHAPSGFSIAAFLNPVNLTKVTESQPFFNAVDFGAGLGWRFTGGLLILGTAEFFGVSQPRQWFIDQYKNNNTAYIINNSPQTSIDVNDNSIFTNKIALTFGFKICYTFDIIKSYYSSSQNITGGTANH